MGHGWIVGTTWRVRELGGRAALERAPELTFEPEGRVTGSTGVNRLMGTYEVSGDVIRFGPAATTRMAGPDDAMAQEQAFLAAVTGEVAFALDGDRLELGPTPGAPPAALLERPTA